MNNALELQKETLISFTDVPKLLPKRRGKKVHYSTIYRWATKGARGRILESQLIGGIRYTSIPALNRFLGTTTVQEGENHEAAALRRLMYGEGA
ncbi:MAG: DUF1580 domain-containing protein [Bdellovibrionales bacterium]|nr:DUF1580 domain-containing protein [Bdellovibrionales bacterium]